MSQTEVDQARVDPQRDQLDCNCRTLGSTRTRQFGGSIRSDVRSRPNNLAWSNPYGADDLAKTDDDHRIKGYLALHNGSGAFILIWQNGAADGGTCDSEIDR